jgi:acetyl esterase/lipase
VAEARGILDRSAPPGPLALRYGTHPDQTAEWWPGGPRCAVLLHGGFWRQRYDRRHLRPLAGALAAAGAAVVLPEFRRSGGAGGWPSTFDDVRELVARLPTDVDAEDVVLVGHSAGGQLALWAAASRARDGLAGVVGLAPVADLGEAHRLGLDGDAVEALMGGSPVAVPGRYAASDPVTLPDPPCPVTLLHDPEDSLVPVELSRRYVRRHPGARLLAVGGGHFGVIDPQSQAWPAVRDSVLGRSPRLGACHAATDD